MASVVVQGAPVVVQSVPPPPHPGVKYAETYKLLGIVQLGLGSASIFLSIIYLIIAASQGHRYDSTGIWCGCLMLAAGALGIASSKNPSSCPITASLILTINAAIAAGIMLPIEILAAVFYSNSAYSLHDSGRAAIHSLLVIIAFGELAASIIHSAYCCAVTCCHTYSGAVLSPSQHTVVTTTTTHPMPMTATTGPGQQMQYSSPSQQYIVQGAVASPTPTPYPPIYKPAPENQQVTQSMPPSSSQASYQPAAQQFQPANYTEKQPLHQ